MSSNQTSILSGSKWIIPIFVAIFLTAFVATGRASEFQKLPETKVDAKMKSVAESIATKILYAMRDGQIKPLGSEATEAMRSFLTTDKQRESYETIKGMYGDFQSMEYTETCIPTDGSLLVIYRFRGHFSKSQAKPEVRVVMDGEGKFAGFWVKPWADEVQ